MQDEQLFEYDVDKNRQLKRERNISFDEIIYSIQDGRLLDIIQHPNKSKYEYQMCYVVSVKEYVYMVPFVRDGNKVFLKTIIPSRKLMRQYKHLLL